MLFTDKSRCAFPSLARKKKIPSIYVHQEDQSVHIISPVPSVLFRILRFRAHCVCPEVILKSAQSTAESFSAIHNKISKGGLFMPCKNIFHYDLNPFFSSSSPTHQTEVAAGFLSFTASRKVTCWFHRSARGCRPLVTGGYLL